MNDDFEIPKDLIQSIVNGNCIAFVGAGFSKSCNLPDWPTLLEKIVDNVDNDIITSNLDELNIDANKINSLNSNFFKDTLQRAFDTGDKLLYETVNKLLQNTIQAEQSTTTTINQLPGSDTSVKVNDKKKLQFLRDTIQKARETSNADLYDLVAQILEDTVGVRYVEKLVEHALQIPKEIPENMRNRLKVLNDIPFKAILTTNFDLFLNGSTPWTAAADSTDNTVTYPYSSILRKQQTQNKSSDTIANSQIEDFLNTLEDVVIAKDNINGTQSQDQRKYFVRSKTSKPLIKLHGSTGLNGLERY